MRDSELKRLKAEQTRISRSGPCRIYCDGKRHLVHFEHTDRVADVGKCDAELCSCAAEVFHEYDDVPGSVAKELRCYTRVPASFVLIEKQTGRDGNKFYMPHEAGKALPDTVFKRGLLLKNGESVTQAGPLGCIRWSNHNGKPACDMVRAQRRTKVGGR